MRKKFWIILFLISALFFYGVPFINGNRLYSMKEIEKELESYSYDYSLVEGMDNSLKSKGPLDYEKNYYFHDNVYDFDFHVQNSTHIFNGGNKLLIEYWSPYFEKMDQAIGSKIKSYIEEEFKDYFTVTDIKFVYVVQDNKWIIKLNENNNIDNYTSYKNDNHINEIYKGIIDIIKTYDPKFVPKHSIYNLYRIENVGYNNFSMIFQSPGCEFSYYKLGINK